MKPIFSLLRDVANLGVRMALEDGRLRLRGPAGALTSEFRAELAARKTEIMDFLQQHPSRSLPPIMHQPHRETAPLSTTQRRLWFLDKLDQDTAMFNLSMAWQLIGHLDVEALEKTCAEICRRHAILRTTFWEESGEAVQVVAPEAGFRLAVEPMPGVDGGHTEDAIIQIAMAESLRPFDLKRAFPLRVRLLRQSEARHLLLLTLHHIASDRWSMNQLVRELEALYTAYVSGQDSPLDELPTQYGDYAAWQQTWMDHDHLATQVDYWKQQLADAPTFLPLPTDRPRPAVQTTAGKTAQFTLDAELTARLLALSRHHSVTLFMTLLAAYTVLLSRYSAQEDLTIGCPVANRVPAETASLIGFFVNTLVLRADLTGNLTFLDLLARIKQVTLDALAHQDMPFDRLVDVLNPERTLSHTPLFQVMFVLQTDAREVLSLPGLAVSDIRLEGRMAEFDLNLIMEQSGQELLGLLEYNTDLFDDDTITRMLNHFRTLIAQLAAAPTQRLANISLLREDERRQILVTWNDTDSDVALDGYLPHRLAAQAARAPDTVAVAAQHEALTYRQLDARANQLAHHLKHLGVGPEVAVGICLERSLGFIIAVLGVLKAGGVYVPLNPAVPKRRLEQILEDTAMRVMIGMLEEGALSAVESLARVSLTEDAATIAQYAPEAPSLNLQANHLGATYYTSGSTGQPKGAMITHGSLITHSLAIIDRYGLTPEDRVLQFSSPDFDVAAEEMFPALMCGATLVLLPSDAAGSFMAFHRFLDEQSPSLLNLPAPFWHEWGQSLAEAETRLPANLRLIVVGSERVLPDRLTLWQGTVGNRIQLFNAYGTTETTITTTVHDPASSVWSGRGEAVPVGRPLCNAHVYLLDVYGQPVPAGLIGEIYIGGAGVARGYANRAAVTAERFVPDPFTSNRGGRLYQAGDFGRFLPDGTLDILGRRDRQIKIRGFRIEPGEIEAALNRHQNVLQSVVLARDTPQGEKRLVAYVLCAPGHIPNRGELDAHMQERLPRYMIPSSLVPLTEFPMTSRGKVDVQALRRIEPGDGRGQEAAQPPRSQEEAILSAIWAGVLSLPEVSVSDNFFALGGDSILSIRVITQANRQGLHLTPKDLFQHQTIADLAQIVRPTPQAFAEQGPVTGAVALTPIQQWFFEDNTTDLHHYNQALVLEMPADTDAGHLQRALATLLSHHDTLRLRYHPEGGGWQQVLEPPDEDVPLVCHDLKGLAAEERMQRFAALAAACQASLDLGSGPLLRAMFVTHGPDAHSMLLLVIHHLAVDSVAWSILLDDLSTAYHQAARGETLRLPAKTSSFQAWASRITAYAQSPDLVQELSYWQHAIQGGDRFVPEGYEAQHAAAKHVAAAAHLNVGISIDATRALLRDAPPVYNTQMNDVLLAALLMSFRQCTGKSQLLVDLEGHGREALFEDLDLSRTAGWFTCVFPVHLQAPGLTQPDDILKQIKEDLRALPHGGIGYGLLRYLSPDVAARLALRESSQADVLFNYLGQSDQMWSAEGWVVRQDNMCGPLQSLAGHRSHLLEINGRIAHGRLQFVWTYPQDQHEVIAAWSQAFIEALHTIIQHCQTTPRGGYTPSDFPHAALTQGLLDQLAEDFGGFETVEGKSQRTFADVMPLSPLQQGILFHSLLKGSSETYFDQMTFTLIGDLDVTAFERAWQDVINRHPALRSFFVWDGLPTPVQIVRRQVLLAWDRQDWQAWSPSEQQAQLAAYHQEDRARSLDLTRAPLMRFALMTLGPQRHQLIWSNHHLLLDGWSSSIVLREVFALYDASINGEPIHLETPRPFVDYLRWLQEQDTDAADAYWREHLRGFAVPTPLVVDRWVGAPILATDTYAHRRLQLSATVTAAIRNVAQDTQVTLNTLLQGAWALLLSRYSGEQDVLFGATVAGRPATLPGVESMVGALINTLPVRVQVPPDVTVRTWLKQLHETQLEREPFAYHSLATIQKFSDVPPGTELFDSLLLFQNYPLDAFSASRHLDVRDLEVDEQTHYPLTLAVVPGAELDLSISYHAARFEPWAIDRMLGHVHTLLEAMVAEPEGRLGEVSLLTGAEKRELLVTLSGTGGLDMPAATIHAYVEAAVGRDPEASGLMFEERELTYGELNAQANQLAHYLQAMGVGPDVLIALFLPRSVDMVVAVLAVWKAGGAYVPLDPAYPQERLAFMLSDCAAPIMLTHEDLLDELPEVGAIPVCLDRDADMIATQPTANPSGPAGPDTLAYVIYTSGSTGLPKGVQGLHRGLCSLAANQQRLFGVGPGDRVLQFAAFSFDASIWEIIMALCAGATLCLARSESLLPGPPLASLLHEMAITHVTLPPSALAGLTWEPFPVLQIMIVAGEACPPALAQRWSAGRRLFNAYGPTEASVCATVCEYDGQSEQLTIGQPLRNVRVHILDQAMQPVPVGVYGELHIGGVSLARGYLNRDALTQEKFVPNPFASVAYTAPDDGRLYKTGDLARYLPNGEIEYLNRLDDQVKVRGFRIELGEVEAALASYSGFRQSAVVAREDPRSHKRLVAYYVAKPDTAIKAEEVSRFLRQRLPDYMIPTQFVALNEMPLTPNGKIHRQALPEPDLNQLGLEASYTAPRTELETTLCEIWADVLGLERIGIHDHFFEIGGDSILALQIVSRCTRTGLGVTLNQLFQRERQTVAGLAEGIAARPATAIDAEEAVGQVPLTPIQHWFFAQDLPERHHYNQAMMFELPADYDRYALQKALQHLLQQHDALRLRYEATPAGWTQIYSPVEEEAPLHVIDLAGHLDGAWQAVLETEAATQQTQLHLETGSLIQVVLFTLGERLPARLLIIIHHLMVDTVSWPIILEDLGHAYEQLARGEAVTLPPKTNSFKRWAESLNTYATTAELEREFAYWLDVLSRDMPALPVNHPAAGGDRNGLNTVASGQTISVTLDAMTTEQLLREVPKAYNTQINDVLLTALVQSFEGLTGAPRLRLNLEGHGREALFENVDVSRTVGWFTSLFPVCLDLDGASNPGDALKLVKETLRAIPNRGIGYGVLRYLSPESEVRNALGALSQAEVSFNYLGQITPAWSSSVAMRLAPESEGAALSHTGERVHLIEVNAMVMNGELQVDWTFSARIHTRDTLQRLADNFMQSLQHLIAYCQWPGIGGYTPSDFPLAGLDQATLDQFLPTERQIEAVYPLASMQEVMLHHLDTHPQSPAYVTQFTCLLEGTLDAARFEQSWRQVVERHPVLRTAFDWVHDGRPLQIVHRKVDLPWTMKDWRKLSETEQQAPFEALLAEERQRRFDPAQAPLMRCYLLRLDDQRHRFVWCFHHLLLDGWSLPMLLQEVFTRYEAHKPGQSPALPPAVPFMDYFRWVHQQDQEAGRQFWRRQLDRLVRPTLFGHAGADPSVITDHTALGEVSLQVEQDLTDLLRAFASRHHLTLNTLALGSWAILLSRHRGESDIVFGTTVAGRPADLPGIETMIGMLINTLPMRVRINDTAQVIAWLQALQEQQQEQTRYAYVPLSRIERESDVRGPLFHTTFRFQNYPVDSAGIVATLDDLSIGDMAITDLWHYALNMVVIPAESLLLMAAYDRQVVDRAWVEKMLRDYVDLLAKVVNDPSGKISAL
uniref:Nonribosomal peptide synthetase n=1 Tax=uncultured Candidatus Entotheonella sp. TaxID=312019 RepID=A0A1L7NR27_9BACT|nr:nonribosomal peptide synthetase [uncultured Candidatus Entotheonella sp.]